MVSMGLNYLLLWQELVIEWNLWQECWIIPFQDYVNDLQDNLCCWFSLHVTSGHCSHIICICTCHHTLSGHMHIICTLFAVVLDIFLLNRQCRCHPYVISSTLYISYHVQLSFCTLSAQTHIVHVVCMLSAHVDIICLSSLTLLIFHYNLIPALETQRLKKSKKLG